MATFLVSLSDKEDVLVQTGADSDSSSDSSSTGDSEDEDVWDKTKESFSEYERRVNTPRPGDPVQRWQLSDFQLKVSASMAASGV